jgi:hypothetical protein
MVAERRRECREMTITVTAPNGATIDFPDGTDHGTINGVMTQHFGGGAEPAEPVTTNNLGRAAATGVLVVGGLLNKMDAATNAALAPVLNPLFAEKDQLSEPTFSERYAHSLRDQNAMDDKFSTQHPYVDTAAKLAGGAAAMAPLVAAAPFALGASGGLGARVAMGGISNAGIGAADSMTRGSDPLVGAALGGTLGAALPAAGALLHGVASPVVSNLRALRDPEGYATSQLSRAVAESGHTPEALGQAVADANAAGAPYTLADALGNPGQRMLATVAKAPGEGRTNAVQFLNDRQMGQGERVGDILDEALGTGPTAQQTRTGLTQQARDESGPLYQQALEQAPVWTPRMQQFFDDPVTARGLSTGVGVQRMESLAAGRPFNPSDYAITHFDAAGDPVIGGVPNMRTVNLIKKGWDQQLEQYRDPTTGRLALDERGRALDQVRRAFLQEVDSINPTYAAARAAYAGPAQVREAVGTGTQAASRGRAADNIARFRALTDPSQQGFRSGYADNLATKIEGSAPGVNKVRPLQTPKRTAELGEMSLHQGPVQPGRLAPLQQNLAREQTMFQTAHEALGNSKTAENLADADAMGVDPHLVGQILTGNWHGAIGSVLRAGHTAMTGNTAPVRAAVGRMLLDRGVTAANLQQAIGDTVARIQFVQHMARSVGRSATGGLVGATGGGQQRRQ